MRKSNTSLIIRGIMLLLALIIMVFVGTLSWFTASDRPVDATGLSITASKPSEFEIALGFIDPDSKRYIMTDYMTTGDNQLSLLKLKGSDGATYNLLKEFVPVDLTGNGALLIRPTMTNKNSAIDINSNTYSPTIPNKEYISFDLYFRSQEQCGAYLDSASVAKGLYEDTNGNFVVTEAQTELNRKSNKGDFSRDAMVGAVRVAFVGFESFSQEYVETTNSEPNLLWLPRPDLRLDDTTSTYTLHERVTADDAISTYTTNYIINTGSTQQEYSVDYNTYKHTYYDFDQRTNSNHGFVTLENTLTSPNGGPSSFICNLDNPVEFYDTDSANAEPVNYYCGKVRVNVWVEGCDSEARRALTGGMFTLQFDLSGGGLSN